MLRDPRRLEIDNLIDREPEAEVFLDQVLELGQRLDEGHAELDVRVNAGEYLDFQAVCVRHLLLSVLLIKQPVA